MTAYRQGKAEFVISFQDHHEMPILQLILKYYLQLTYQEAHEVQREDGGNPSEGQALQHGTADPGRVAVFFGSIVVTVGLTRTGRVSKTPHRLDKMFHLNHCNILTKNLRRTQNRPKLYPF